MEDRLTLTGAQSWHAEAKQIIYGLRYDAGLIYVTSDREVVSEEEAEKKWLILSRPSRRCRLTTTGRVAILKGHQVHPASLYAEIKHYFDTYVEFPQPYLPMILSLWTMGTYLFQAFSFFPYLAINSYVKRSGKSLTLRLLHQLCFQSGGPDFTATPARLFRDIHCNTGTVLLDEVETLSDADRDHRGQLLAVLCGGFEQGGVVTRNDVMANKQYRLVEFFIYCPKVFAGINEVADIVRDRSICFTMEQSLERLPFFDVEKMIPELRDIRDKLYLWGLTYAKEASTIYRDHAGLVLPDELDHRLNDIARPLVALARIVGCEAPLVNALLRISQQKKLEEEGIDGEHNFAKQVLLRVLDVRAADPSEGLVFKTRELMEIMHEAGMADAESEKKVRHIMKRLGVRSQSHRRGDDWVRGYRITQKHLKKGEK